MLSFKSESVGETCLIGKKIALQVKHGAVIALYGGLGMGKTAFTRGFAEGRGIKAEVSSPTFALVHEYGGCPPVYHFDMYRVKTWDDLYTTGFFDYIDAGGILVVEWSENIENALPQDVIRIHFERGESENERIITVQGAGEYENFSC